MFYNKTMIITERMGRHMGKATNSLKIKKDGDCCMPPGHENVYDFRCAEFKKVIEQIKNKRIIKDYLTFLSKEQT